MLDWVPFAKRTPEEGRNVVVARLGSRVDRGWKNEVFSFDLVEQRWYVNGVYIKPTSKKLWTMQVKVWRWTHWAYVKQPGEV